MPRPRRASVESQAGISLAPTANRRPITNERRSRFLDAFSVWIRQELGAVLDDVAASSYLLGTALVAFGKYLFYSGEPKYVFIETLNAVVDLHPHFKGQLAAAWTLVTKWEEAEGNGDACCSFPSCNQHFNSLGMEAFCGSFAHRVPRCDAPERILGPSSLATCAAPRRVVRRADLLCGHPAFKDESLHAAAAHPD